MFLDNLFENTGKNITVVYPGRYMPPHKGHKAVYDHLCQKYGGGNVYIVTSDKTDNLKSPFNFAEKRKMWTLMGVSSDKVIMSTQPYQAMEIVSKLDPSSILMFAISEKDMAEDPRFQFAPKKNGSPSYFQPFKDAKLCKPLSEHAYMITVPTFEFTVLGKPANSASQIRAQFGNADVETKKKIVADLFGKFDPVVFNIMNNKLLPVPAAVGESTIAEAGKKGMSKHAKEVARKRKEYDDAESLKRKDDGYEYHYGTAKVTVPPKTAPVNEISNDLSKNYMRGALHDTISNKKDRNPGITKAMNRLSGTQYPLIPDTENPDPKIRSLAIAVEKMKNQLASLTGQPTTATESKKFSWCDHLDLDVEARMNLAESWISKNNGLLEANDPSSDEYFLGIRSDIPHIGKKYVFTFLSLTNNLVTVLRDPCIATLVKNAGEYYIVKLQDGQEVEFPIKSVRDKMTAKSFFFKNTHSYNAFRSALKIKFNTDLPNITTFTKEYTMKKVNELSSNTLGKYKKDASETLPKNMHQAGNRAQGVAKAKDKINDKEITANAKAVGHPMVQEADLGGVPWGPVAQKEYFEHWHKWDQEVRFNGGTTEHAGDGTYRAVGIDGGGIGQWNEHTGEGWIDLTGESDLEEGRFVKGPGGVPLDRQGNPRAVSFPSKQSTSSGPAARTTTDDSGVKVTHGKYHGPRKSEAPGFGSKHIGSGNGKDTTKGQVSGLGANTGKYVKPVVTADVNGDEASAVKEAGRFVKGPGGVPLDRYGDPIPPKAPKAPAPKKLTLDDVWRKVEDVVGQIYPDGDPIDWMAPWLERHGIEDFKIGEIIDRAARKNGYKDMYDYWKQLDDQMKSDAEYDSHQMTEGGEDPRWKLYAKDDEKGYTCHHIPHSEAKPGEQRFKHSLNGKTVMSHTKHYPDEMAKHMNEEQGVSEGAAPWAANWKKAALASKKALQSPSGANHKRAAELHKHGASDPWGPYKDKHEEAFAKHTKAAKVYGGGAEQVDELSTDTMKRYMGAANKSRTDATTKFNQTGNIDPKTMDKMGNRAERTMKTANKVKAAEPMESKRSLKAIVKEMHAQAAQGDLRAVAECVRALVPFKQKESLKEGIMTNVTKALKVAKRNAR